MGMRRETSTRPETGCALVTREEGEPLAVCMIHHEPFVQPLGIRDCIWQSWGTASKHALSNSEPCSQVAYWAWLTVRGLEVFPLKQPQESQPYITRYLISTGNNHHKKAKDEDFPGGAVDKNPPANAVDVGPTPGPGGSHMPRARSLCAATTAPCTRAHKLRLLKPSHLASVLSSKRRHRSEKRTPSNEEQPCSPPEKARAKQ